MSEPTIRTLSLGAGRQSTVLFILGCEGELLPKLDAAVFADTQWEPRHVMEHLAALQQFGEEHGVPVYMASKGSLPKDVLDRQVFATLPAWTKSKPYEMAPVAFGPCPSCDTPAELILAGYSGNALFGDDTCLDCDGTGLVPVRWEKRFRKKSANGRHQAAVHPQVQGRANRPAGTASPWRGAVERTMPLLQGNR